MPESIARDRGSAQTSLGDILGSVMSLFSPGQAQAEVVPMDEEASKYVEQLKAGKSGEAAKTTYNLAHALRDKVEVFSGGPVWELLAKEENLSPKQLEMTNTMGGYNDRLKQIGLNPNLEYFEQHGSRYFVNNVEGAKVLAHELAHFIIKKSEYGKHLRFAEEAIADQLSGRPVDPRYRNITEISDIILRDVGRVLEKEKGQQRATRDPAVNIGAVAGSLAAKESEIK